MKPEYLSLSERTRPPRKAEGRLGYILCAVLLVCLSCKKDRDLLAPVITWNQPAAASRHAVFDTVHTQVNISDESTLVSLRISVVNESMVAVLPVIQVYPAGKDYLLQTAIPLNDVHLSTGKYYLLVAATDGENESRAFRDIYIDELPLDREAIFGVTLPGGQPAVARYDGSIPAPVISIPGDYAGSALNSWDRQLYITGKYTGNLQAYNLDTYASAWSKAGNMNAPWPTFEGLAYYNRLCYSFSYEGFIRAYDRDGIPGFNSAVTDGYSPIFIFPHESYLITMQRAQVGSAQKLVVIRQGSGVGIQEIMTDVQVVRMFSRTPDHVMVFGNRNGQGIIEEYTISQNGFWEPHTLPAGPLLDVAQPDANTYLVAQGDGIRKYRYNPNSLTDFLPGVAAQRLLYDDSRVELLAAQGAGLKIYHAGNGTLLDQAVFADSLVDIHILYNK